MDQDPSEDPVPAPPDEKLDFDDDTLRGKKANCKLSEVHNTANFWSYPSPSSKRKGDFLTLKVHRSFKDLGRVTLFKPRLI